MLYYSICLVTFLIERYYSVAVKEEAECGVGGKADRFFLEILLWMDKWQLDGSQPRILYV